MKLVDNRRCPDGVVRELRSQIHAVDSGEVTGIILAAIRKDGSVRVYDGSDCAIRGIGAAELLKQKIMKRLREE